MDIDILDFSAKYCWKVKDEIKFLVKKVREVPYYIIYYLLQGIKFY